MKQFVKQFVSDSMMHMVRSARYCGQLGVLPEYLKTGKNRAAKVRLGNAYGGWVIPVGSIEANSICYCVGCGEDISFDVALINQYACAVDGIDPTPKAVEFVKRETQNQPLYRLHEVALWSEAGSMKFFTPADSSHVSHSLTNLQETSDYIEVDTVRLSALMKDNGHKELTLLKLDVEGAENTIVSTLLEDKISCDILCIEFDELLYPTTERLTQISQTIRALFSAGYQLFWVESSNFTFVRGNG